MRTIRLGLFNIMLLLLLLAAEGMIWIVSASARSVGAKNVIVMIVDGCSTEQVTLARWYKGSPLAMDSILTGSVITHSADSVITDSAPSATAYATGYRTTNRSISMGPGEQTLSTVHPPPPELRLRPLATVLEGARLMGKSTGIVATSRITHATPAAFVAHVPSRSTEHTIMEQMIHQGVDVVLGGGRMYMSGAAGGEKTGNMSDLWDVLRARGYRLAEDRAGLMNIHSGKVFALFSEDHMVPEIDRSRIAPNQPTLEEMTQKAIDILSKDPDGFFLMVEGSQVDWACHANDPAYMVSEILMFDKAVAAALDFARRDGRTLLLVLPDHNTAGFSIGNHSANGKYGRLTVEELLDPLRKMVASSGFLWSQVKNEQTPDHVKSVVRQYWGLDITDEEAGRILELARSFGSAPHNAFGRVICPVYTCFGWTSHGHVGGDVPLYAFGPGRPSGVVQSPDIGRITFRAMGLDSDRLNARLFVEARKAFDDGTVEIEKSDGEKTLVKVRYGGRTAELTVNRDGVRMEGRSVTLEGIVIYVVDTDRLYIPVQAVNIIRGRGGKLPRIAAEARSSGAAANRAD